MTDDESEHERAALPGDDELVMISGRSFRMRANDMRALRKATGLTMGELLDSDDLADQTQAMAFLSLRRKYPDTDAGELWEAAGDVNVAYDEDEAPTPPDPTAGPSS